eukprot:74465_1
MDKLWYKTDLNTHSHHAPPIIRWLPICEQMHRRDERMHEINVDSRRVKILCVLLMVSSAFLMFFGRGTFGLIQGVLGVIAGIEGYYGAMEYSIQNIKILLTYLCISTLCCIAIVIYSQYSADSYCNVKTEEQKKECQSAVLGWTILYLSIGFVFNNTVIVYVLRFYWKIRKIYATKKIRHNTLLD